MDAGLVIAIALAIAFAVTNGFHDAANSIAAWSQPVLRPRSRRSSSRASSTWWGHSSANTIGGMVPVDPSASNQVTGGGLAAAVVWNLATWTRGLPSSSAQALVGGLLGAALAEGASTRSIGVASTYAPYQARGP